MYHACYTYKLEDHDIFLHDTVHKSVECHNFAHKMQATDAKIPFKVEFTFHNSLFLTRKRIIDRRSKTLKTHA